jgi:predicted lipoprotein with Yx(FWY)xxD motif/plastocyanin
MRPGREILSGAKNQRRDTMKMILQRHTKTSLALFSVALIIMALVALAACSSYGSKTPSIEVTSPVNGSTIPAGNVTVSVQVSNFNLVDKLGQPNVSGEGHIHYFLDYPAPTEQGKPAIPPSGANVTWAATPAMSYTFDNVGPGSHTIYVELVNNDHTPLNPPVVESVTFTVSAVSVNIASKTGIGSYLVDSKGLSLYYTMRDSPGVSNVPDNLLTTWIPFYVSNIVVPSSLNASDFGTITRSNGQQQTTFRGYPLYYYVGDKAAGDTNGQGIGGVWYVVTPTNFPPTPTPTPTIAPTATPTTTAQSVTIDLTAHNIAFNLSTITVPACADVTVNFSNEDAGFQHNFAVYTNSSATTTIFNGQVIVGVSSTVYHFTAPCTPGTYFFRCNIHPTIMFGTFVVTS